VIRRIGVVAFVMLALVGAACSKETTTTTAAGGDDTQTTQPGGEDTPTSTPSIVISSGSETVSIGGGEIPENFPAEFPLPDDAQVVFSGSSGQDFAIWFSSSMSLDELNAFFDAGFPANGWTIDGQFDFTDASGGYRAYSVTGNGYTGGVYVGEGAPGSEGFGGDFAFFVVLSPEA
jgi:hypothetical protein